MKRNYFLIAALLVLTCLNLSAREIHVSKTGSDSNNGSAESPYLTISKAAYVAIAGDDIIIHEGVYREWVSPANGGISPARRISYSAAEGEDVCIKGSEQISKWKKVGGGVWSTTLSNDYFGDFNPFAINLFGDWLKVGGDLHLGAVYLNNVALDEIAEVESVKSLEEGRWYTEVDDQNTTIYANFGKSNPTKELVEINVRPTCFFPKTTGINYITVDGIAISQAATQWSAPTNEQTGIIGPNWSKEWIIRNCDISHSKCVGICLGKERASGHNMWTLYKNSFGYTKCGFNREIEAILKAYDLGWSKENIGSHIIENNRIDECGQAGIVGHLGCSFSVIRHNRITNCSYKGDFDGFETGGIKLHAAIDVIIDNNIIVNTRRSIWLDWQAQGTQVCNNVFAKSITQDLFIEVSHGPTFIYNNVMLSDLNLLVNAQGLAYFNNIFAGRCHKISSQERYTPYHAPHSTKIRGLFNNTGGDVRFYNNLFLGTAPEQGSGANGLSAFDELPAMVDNSKIKGVRGTGASLKFVFPMWSEANVYYNGAKPYKHETGATIIDEKPTIELIECKDGSYKLSHTIDIEKLKELKGVAVNTEMLGQTFISEQIFENPDATPFTYNRDFFGEPQDATAPIPGAFVSKSDAPIWNW